MTTATSAQKFNVVVDRSGTVLAVSRAPLHSGIGIHERAYQVVAADRQQAKQEAKYRRACNEDSDDACWAPAEAAPVVPPAPALAAESREESSNEFYGRLNARFDERAKYLRGRGYKYEYVEGYDIAVFTFKSPYRRLPHTIAAATLHHACDRAWRDIVEDVERNTSR